MVSNNILIYLFKDLNIIYVIYWIRNNIKIEI